ncbi:protein tyrosine phosphatase type IVA 1 isoform X1 [Acanthopagrus latus]|nr:protein tyrosine phosphatase type IVA 1 isoform X1 [Acanthopagrus latus]XP_036955062.1 protein tyrosine phosphatase type IVA 1 isoform X1 [Acanthopagrus latus]
MARMNRPAPVEITYKNMRFLITHNPTNATLNKFIEELKKYGVTTVVRVCEATYDATLVVKEGIQVLDWPFDDGAPPSNQIVDDWLNLLKLKFREEPGCCVAVHCVAGLGRAPVLVALALIECGMKYEDAVQFIRQTVKRKSGSLWTQCLNHQDIRTSGSVEERSTASSCSTWRNIVQRCACASKIPTAIAITAASSRAKTLSHANPDPQQKSRVQLKTWQACFLSHCVEVFYFGKTILGKFTCPLPTPGSKASVKENEKKKKRVV